MSDGDTEVRNRNINNNDLLDTSVSPDELMEEKKLIFKANINDIVDLKRTEFTKTIKNVEIDFNEFLDGLKHSIIERVSETEEQGSLLKPKSNKTTNNLPEKVFVCRESVLTSLFKISHIRTVYHMFVAILIIFSLNTIITDWVEKGGIIHIYHLEWVIWAFGKVGGVVSIWLMMQISVLFVYPTFLTWLSLRRANDFSLVSNYVIDCFFLGVYILFQMALLIWPLNQILTQNLPPCSSAIVILENIRFMMKMHAFIRHNSVQEFNTDNLIDRINFSRYLYFLFAPTLVYRDSYPRNPVIRWSYVASNFSQVFICMVYMYYIFARFCIQYFQNFNSTHVSVQQLVVSIFGCMLPGTLVLLICFFCFLHSWLNAFAEMMRFGDRLFYKEWWNSTTFSNYYRTWNVLVHDWLYTYIYRDILLCSRVKSRNVAMTVVFLVSAVVHEYVLIVIFRFFFPVLFVLFGGAGFGMMFLKGRSRFWNIGFWVAMFTGTGILLCLYSMEWYARINCPLYFYPVIDAVLPRSLFCHA